MTFVLFNLLLAGAPPFLIWNLGEVAPAPIPATHATARVVVRADDQAIAEDLQVIVLPDGENTGDGVWVMAEGGCEGVAAAAVPLTIQVSHGDGQAVEGSHEMIIQAVDAQHAEGEAPKMVFVRSTGDGVKDGNGRTALVRVAPKGQVQADADPDRGWLGVSVGDVSDALAEQLNTEGKGVLILNVVSDSPADKAGIQAHDIIVAINGETVEGEVGRTVDLIKARKPGEAVAVNILRDGKPQTLRVTLGSRAEMPTQAFAWKFETAPEGQVEESVKTRGKFIAKGADGQWIVRDLGDLNNPGALPDNVRMFLPRSGERSASVNVEGGKSIVKVNVSQDGSTISIKREGDGPITVERTDASGNKSVADYDSEEELESADAEAYKMFQGGGGVALFQFDGGNLFDGNFNFDFDPSDFHNAMGAYKVELEGHMGEAKEAYQKAMEELHTALEKAKVEGLDGKLGELKGLMELQHLEPGKMGFLHHSKPRQSFEVRPDGTIESRVRKGDSELVELYKSESDLQKRNPDLYEKYEDLKSDKE